jgi:hypothetical protein
MASQRDLEDARRVWDRLCAVDVVVRRLKP